MKLNAEVKNYTGEKIIVLQTGDYEAYIAPTVGSNVFRFHDVKKDIEVLRFDEKLSLADIRKSPEVYGLPTLYLPNRLDKGMLKTSDAFYQLPINEAPLNNYIHGFLHKREHDIVSVETYKDYVEAKTEYTYDENDEFFSTFPVSFKAEYVFKLSDKGLDYSFTMTNLSKVMMPYGVCNHTSLCGPFTKDGDGNDMRLYVPIGEKIELDNRCLPTGEIEALTDHDKQYLTGSMVPVLHVLDNDMYYGETGDLDGKPFYGAVATDVATGAQVVYEVCKDFKFFIIWNDRGEKGYFCPEPMTWIIDAPNQNLPSDESGYMELAPNQSKTLTEKLYIK